MSHVYLQEYLHKIATHPNSKLIVQVDHAWVVLHSFSPANRILFEVASNLYLSEAQQLTTQQIQQLETMGYQKRRKDRSIGSMIYLSTEQDFTTAQRNIELIFEEVFQITSKNYQYIFKDNVKVSLSNPKLHSIMKKLGRDKQHGNRILLYQTLIGSELLVYITEDEQLYPYDTISTLITYAAFTEYKYIQQFDPRGCTVRLYPCYELIPLLLQNNAGSLILNPRGDIRGELYKNELQSIGSALRRNRS